MATFMVGPNTGPMQAAYLAQLQDAYMRPGIAEMGSAWTRPLQYGGSAMGGAAGGAMGVPQDYQRAYEEAKAANEERYKNILTGYQDRSNQYQEGAAGLRDDVLGGYDARYQRNMNALQGQGQQEAIDIQRRYGELGAANQQDMVNRGLTGTTIMPTMRQGIAREQEGALSRLNERLINQRLGLDSQLSGDALSAQERLGQSILQGAAGVQGDKLGFAERRTDAYPDMNQLINLAAMYGAAGGMYGGGNQYQPDMISMQQMGYQIPQWNQFGFVQPVAPQRPAQPRPPRPFEWEGPVGVGVNDINGPIPRSDFGKAAGFGAANGAFLEWRNDGLQFDPNGLPGPGAPGAAALQNPTEVQLASLVEQATRLNGGRPPQTVEEAVYLLEMLDRAQQFA